MFQSLYYSLLTLSLQYERQLERKQDDATRNQLDQEFDDIRGLLLGEPSSGASTKLNDIVMKDKDMDYDQHVRELALDRRAKPKDRTKTEEELAVEAKEALEKAEKKRLKRMMGEEDDSDDEGAEGRGKKRPREAGGDDLEDDFENEDALAWDGLGAGLQGGARAGDGDEDGSDADDGSQGEEDEDEDGESASGSEGDDDESENAEEPAPSRPTSKKPSKPSTNSAVKELPFTFPCPETHDEFLAIVKDVEDAEVPVVVQRIRSLYHPSLAEDNKFKLQVRE